MNLLISGCTCSGKTTLAKKICDLSTKSTCVMSEDWYYKNRSDIPHMRGYLLLDSPNAFNIDEFVKDSNELITAGKVKVPIYNVENNERLSKELLLYGENINIFEGLHTIDSLKSFRDSIKIFLDTDIETCLKRRIERDMKNNPELNEKSITEYFFTIVFPMYKAYIEKKNMKLIM